METTRLHAVLISSPGLSHFRSAFELGKVLATNHNFKATIFFVSTRGNSPEEQQLINNASNNKLVEVIQIPAPDISGQIHTQAKLFKTVCTMMREVRPSLLSMLATITPKPTVLILDMFASESINIAQELKLPKYVFVPCTAWFLALTIYVPVLDKVVKGEYVNQTEDLKLPGCRPLRPEDVVEPMLERTDPDYEEYMGMGEEFTQFDGVLLNTWEDLEPETLLAFNENNAMKQVMNAPVYAIGPITGAVPEPRDLKSHHHDDEVFKWLDHQSAKSVLYVSFGSGGAISSNQLHELAHGLGLSQQPFIWVIRTPIDHHQKADSSYLSMSGEPDDDDMSKYFPADFFEKNHRKLGFMMPKWAPQVEILSHPAIGGFLTHCGWNSVLESIQNGIPMIAWPLYAEQRMNATMLVEELQVAIRTKELPTKKTVGREEIEKLMRILLVDEKGRFLRNRVSELKNSGNMALAVEVGSSYKSLTQFVQQFITN